MGDLTGKEASQSVKVVGNDSSGLETNPVNATTLGEMTIADRVANGGVDTILTVTETASEGKVGLTRLQNRKYIWMQGITVPNNPNSYILWGFSNTTQSFKLFKDQILCFPIGEGTQIWFKSPVVGSYSVAFGEAA